MATKKIAAAVLSLALLAPAEAGFAKTIHHRRVVHHTTITRVNSPHHYSRTRGTAIGAVVGALIEHRHPLKGAVIGGALGNAVQYGRNVHERHKHHRH